MNKNEFAENLVKEFSVKHPNYSASVKKPEEAPVTDDVCAMFQKNRTVILVHMDAAFEDYCQHGIEVVLQKIDNSLTYCEKNGKKGEELVDTLDCYESIKDRLFIRAFNCETGRKKMENGGMPQNCWRSNAGPVCIFGDHRWKDRIDYDSC